MIFLILHNVHNVQRLLDIVKLYLSVEVEDKLLVISKPSGPAATDGIAEANKIVFKSEGRMLVVPDLQDVLELLKPERMYLLVGGGGDFESRIKKVFEEGGDVAFVVSGQEIGFTRQELSFGEKLEIPNLPSNPPPTSIASILVYTLNKMLKGKR